MSPSTYAIAGLSIALAASLAGTAAVGNMYLAKRDEVAALTSDLRQVSRAAEACTKSVEGISAAAQAQTKAALAAMAAAKAAADKRDKAADEELATPASVPGDDCKSAQERADRWLLRRTGK